MFQFIIRRHFHIPHYNSEQVCEISHHMKNNAFEIIQFICMYSKHNVLYSKHND